MRTLVLLCGRPFSGKSTLAARLAAECGAAVVSFDAINLERGLHGGDGLPAEEWARTLGIAKERTRALLAAHPLVVIDDTLCYRWLREEFRTLAAEAGAAVVLLFLEPLTAIVEARMREGTRRGIVPEVLEAHLAGFEAPAADEDAIGLRSSEEMDAWLP